MIRGHKPAAYFSTGDGTIKIEGEQHQCVHCQFLWTPRPGSGTRRGYCLRCDGYLCARPECEALQKSILAEFEYLSGSTDRKCMPYTDYVERKRDALIARGFDALPSGVIILPK